MSQRPSFKRPAPPSPLRCTGSCLRAVAVAAAFACGRPEHTSERLPRTRPRREHPHLPPTRGEARLASPRSRPRGVSSAPPRIPRTRLQHRKLILHARGTARRPRAPAGHASRPNTRRNIICRWTQRMGCALSLRTTNFFFFFYQHSNYSVHSRRNEISTMRETKIRAKSGRRFTPDTRARYLA